MHVIPIIIRSLIIFAIGYYGLLSTGQTVGLIRNSFAADGGRPLSTYDNVGSQLKKMEAEEQEERERFRKAEAQKKAQAEASRQENARQRDREAQREKERQKQAEEQRHQWDLQERARKARERAVAEDKEKEKKEREKKEREKKEKEEKEEKKKEEKEKAKKKEKDKKSSARSMPEAIDSTPENRDDYRCREPRHTLGRPKACRFDPNAGGWVWDSSLLPKSEEPRCREPRHTLGRPKACRFDPGAGGWVWDESLLPKTDDPRCRELRHTGGRPKGCRFDPNAGGWVWGPKKSKGFPDPRCQNRASRRFCYLDPVSRTWKHVFDGHFDKGHPLCVHMRRRTKECFFDRSRRRWLLILPNKPRQTNKDCFQIPSPPGCLYHANSGLYYRVKLDGLTGPYECVGGNKKGGCIWNPSKNSWEIRKPFAAKNIFQRILNNIGILKTYNSKAIIQIRGTGYYSLPSNY